MWICLNTAFLSAVQDRNDPTRLCVRARRRDHLEALFPDTPVIDTPRADYAHRMFVPKRVFAEALVQRVEAIDYPNFKNSVRDPALHDLYAAFWRRHRSYQREWKERAYRFAWGPGDLDHS